MTAERLLPIVCQPTDCMSQIIRLSKQLLKKVVEKVYKPKSIRFNERQSVSRFIFISCFSGILLRNV